MRFAIVKNSILVCILICSFLLTSCKTSHPVVSPTTIATKPIVTSYATLSQALAAKLQHTHITITDKNSYLNLGMVSHYVFTKKNAINNNFKKNLTIIVSNLQQYHYKKIIIASYTDNQGQLLSNEHLSKTWASTIKNYLVNQGLSRNTITIEANGEYAPIASNYTFAERLLNCRVELHIYS